MRPGRRAIAVDLNGLSVFDLIRYRQQDHAVTLCAFDLLDLNGEDLRNAPLELRKATLKGLLRRGAATRVFVVLQRPLVISTVLSPATLADVRTLAAFPKDRTRTPAASGLSCSHVISVA